MLKRIVTAVLCAAIFPAVFLLTSNGGYGSVDSAYLDAQGRAYLACYEEKSLIILQYSANGEITGQWNTERYDGFDYFVIDDLCFDGEGRAFCAVSRVSSIDYSLMSQTWLEIDFDTGSETVLYSEAYTDRTAPDGVTLLYSDGALLSLTYYPGEILRRDVLIADEQQIAAGTEGYINYAGFISTEQILVSDIFGGLYLLAPDGTRETLRDREGGISSVIIGGDQNIYIYESDTGLWKQSRPDGSAFFLSAVSPQTSAVAILDENRYIAMESGEAVYYKGQDGAVTLRLPADFSVRGLVLSIAAGVLLGTCCVVISLFMRRKRISILVKITVPVIITLTLGAAFLIYSLGEMFERAHEDAKITQAFLSAAEMVKEIDPVRLSEIDWANPAGNEYFEYLHELFSYNSIVRNVKKLLPDDNVTEFPMSLNAYYVLIISDGETLRSGVYDDSFINAPIMAGSRVETEYMALFENSGLALPLSGYESEDSDWLSVAVPVTSEDGKTVAVVEAGFSKRQYLYEAETSLREIILKISAVIGTAAMALIICLIVILSSVKRLKRAVETAAAGDYGVSVLVKGRDEIAEISAEFNKMAERIDSYTGNLKDLNKAYMRFFPGDISNMLGKESVLSVDRGQCKRIDTNILHLHILRLDNTLAGLNDDGIFEYVNKLSGAVVETVLSAGGIIESCRQAEYICLFEDADMALDTAIQISRALRNLSPAPEITQTIVRGGAIMGVIGYEKRLGTMLLSRMLELTKKLRRLGSDCGARILYAGNLDLKRPYYRRSLGGMMFEGGRLDIFECIEGDEDSVYRSKRDNISLFDKGVELFERKEWEKCRSAFIKYIKEASPDAAAKYFLLQCDENC